MKTLLNNTKSLEEQSIAISIFIPKIASKSMQDLIFFLQKNNFKMKRITRAYNNKKKFANIKNSNFILENNCHMNSQQLKNILFFLKQHTNINSIFFQNQFLNVERIASFEEQPKFNFWKKINSLII